MTKPASHYVSFCIFKGSGEKLCQTEGNAVFVNSEQRQKGVGNIQNKEKTSFQRNKVHERIKMKQHHFRHVLRQNAYVGFQQDRKLWYKMN